MYIIMPPKKQLQDQKNKLLMFFNVYVNQNALQQISKLVDKLKS
jgi:hypothetical protein